MIIPMPAETQKATTKTIEIKILSNLQKETALLELDTQKYRMTFKRKNGFTKTYKTDNYYSCFGQLRADLPEITFLCKGSKINVHPSSMSSQMSRGLVAYELTLGTPSEETDMVRIFDYEEKNLTNNIEEQKQFYARWRDSFNAPTKCQI
ncbi:hypothetical protein [Pseudomonas sp. B11(2017)]|uniref:hypothetical protein n=1 Tax=Pseudomonas sp. B11(2017) TaxID=1981748 RepID=UPI002114764A|nr:hypothetical protein [Pseudomonas sp. B11(2017)]